MSYADAVEFLYSLQVFGAQFGLEKTHRLAALAGHPQHQLRFIHVAGTNGKGSTCAILEAICRAAGLRVGLYTSPHLVSFRERIQVNRTLVSEADVVRLVADARRWLESFLPKEHPTFFEVVTVMALRCFAEQRCDLVVWETGLGGRLDATNIVTPLASVITNVQFDHEQWLGNTLPLIAREKAGIIKPRVPVVTGVDDPAALAVIEETAARLCAPLHVVPPGRAVLPAPLASMLAATLPGEHQQANAAVALETIDALKGAVPISAHAISAGFADVRWPGRFEIVARGAQTIVLDGAHNPAGARALAATLKTKFGSAPKTLIIGALEDKNWTAVCNSLAEVADRVLTVPLPSKRAADPQAIAEVCRRTQPSAEVAAEPSLARALDRAADDPLVVITGSLYLVGEAMQLLGISDGAGRERELNEWRVQSR